MLSLIGGGSSISLSAPSLGSEWNAHCILFSIVGRPTTFGGLLQTGEDGYLVGGDDKDILNPHGTEGMGMLTCCKLPSLLGGRLDTWRRLLEPAYWLPPIESMRIPKPSSCTLEPAYWLLPIESMRMVFWPCCMFLTMFLWCITSCCDYGHCAHNTFVSLTEGRSARDLPKQQPANKKKTKWHWSCSLAPCSTLINVQIRRSASHCELYDPSSVPS